MCVCPCSIGGAPGSGGYIGLATNVTLLQEDFPARGLNGTAVNVSKLLLLSMLLLLLLLLLLSLPLLQTMS